MASRIIRSIEDLPDWFDLSKYRGISDLTSSEWYEILLQRWTHIYFIESQGIQRYKEHDDGEPNKMYLALLESRENPLYLLQDISQIYLIGGGQLDALKNYPKEYSLSLHAISHLTFRRLYQIENRLTRDAIKRVRHWFDTFFDETGSDILSDDFKKETNWVKSLIDEPIFDAIEKEGRDGRYREHRKHDLVEVDLSIPDKILQEQFSAYLKYVRKRYPYIKEAPKYKYPEYEKWVEYSVIPYIDLKIWGIENKVTIPNRVMADAIYKDYSKGEETVRKTTSKISDLIIDKNYIDFLATIVADDIAEQD